MQHSFWADDKDVWKWSVAASVAGDRAILYAAMISPLPPRAKPITKSARPEVLSFFDAERLILEKEAADRVGRLMHRFPKIVLAEGSYRRPWSDYFEALKKALGEVGRAPLLVLLDPDTGVKIGGSTKKHLGTADLNQLWGAMAKGDSFLIFQNALRAKNWVKVVLRLIVEDAGIPATVIEHHPGARICMYEIRK